MIRNQMMADPESSPPRGNMYSSYSGGGSSGVGAVNDDPWYTSSGPPSPAVSAPAQSAFGYAAYNPAPVPTPYGVPQSFGYDRGADGDLEDFDNEPPLLEELGINFQHILQKTQAVLYVTKPVEPHILDDTDLAGPLFFCLLLGAALLLKGKMHFGYIYGLSMFSCLGLTMLLSLMHPHGMDIWTTCSVLGYCLLPVLALAVLAIVFSLDSSLAGLVVAALAIAWASVSATRLVDAHLQLTEQYWLVFYPVMLLYSCFVLITIF